MHFSFIFFSCIIFCLHWEATRGDSSMRLIKLDCTLPSNNGSQCGPGKICKDGKCVESAAISLFPPLPKLGDQVPNWVTAIALPIVGVIALVALTIAYGKKLLNWMGCPCCQEKTEEKREKEPSTESTVNRNYSGNQMIIHIGKVHRFECPKLDTEPFPTPPPTAPRPTPPSPKVAPAVPPRPSKKAPTVAPPSPPTAASAPRPLPQAKPPLAGALPLQAFPPTTTPPTVKETVSK